MAGTGFEPVFTAYEAGLEPLQSTPLIIPTGLEPVLPPWKSDVLFLLDEGTLPAFLIRNTETFLREVLYFW